MIEIIHAENGEALEEVVRLSQEYVTWMMAEVRAHYPDLTISEVQRGMPPLPPIYRSLVVEALSEVGLPS